MKRCSMCGKEKPLEEFSHSSRHPDGRQGWCRECYASYHRDWRKGYRKKPSNLVERFLAGVEKVASGCWLWGGTAESGDYGSWSVDGKSTAAHRASYELFVGPIPEGLDVCHSCDVPACVNPGHLFLGTHQDNMDDGKAKARFARGGRHGRITHPEEWGDSKLTADAVRAIRQLPRRRGLATELAGHYKTTVATIYRALVGQTWKHVV